MMDHNSEEETSELKEIYRKLIVRGKSAPPLSSANPSAHLRRLGIKLSPSQSTKLLYTQRARTALPVVDRSADNTSSLRIDTSQSYNRYDKIRVPAPHPSVVSLPSPEPQRVKTAPLCRSSLAMYSPQTQRFTMEQLALEQAKLLKKMTAVQSHRVDHRYYVSGRQKQIANRYDVNSEQYHVLITMANQRRQYSGHHIGHRHSHLHKSMPPMDKDVEIEVVSSSNKVCREGDLLQCEDGANPQISPRQVVVRTPEVDHESVPYNENDAVQENHRPTKSVEFKEVTQQGTAANVGDKEILEMTDEDVLNVVPRLVQKQKPLATETQLVSKSSIKKQHSTEQAQTTPADETDPLTQPPCSTENKRSKEEIRHKASGETERNPSQADAGTEGGQGSKEVNQGVDLPSVIAGAAATATVGTIPNNDTSS